MAGDEGSEPSGSGMPASARLACRLACRVMLLTGFTMAGWLLTGTAVSHAASVDPMSGPPPTTRVSAAAPSDPQALPGQGPSRDAPDVGSPGPALPTDGPRSGSPNQSEPPNSAPAAGSVETGVRQSGAASAHPGGSMSGGVASGLRAGEAGGSTPASGSAAPASDPTSDHACQSDQSDQPDQAIQAAHADHPGEAVGSDRSTQVEGTEQSGGVDQCSQPGWSEPAGSGDRFHQADQADQFADEPAGADKTDLAAQMLAPVTATLSPVTGPSLPDPSPPNETGTPNTERSPTDAADGTSTAPVVGVVAKGTSPDGASLPPASAPWPLQRTRSLGGPPAEYVRTSVTERLHGGRSAPAVEQAAPSSSPAAAGPRDHQVRADLPGAPPGPEPGNCPSDQSCLHAPLPEQVSAGRSGLGQVHHVGGSAALPVDGYAARPPFRAVRPAAPGVVVCHTADRPTTSPD